MVRPFVAGGSSWLHGLLSVVVLDMSRSICHQEVFCFESGQGEPCHGAMWWLDLTCEACLVYASEF